MYEIFKNQEGNFAFRLKDQNGNILLTSDGYTQKTNCLKGVSSVKRNSKNIDRFITNLSKSGKHYLILKSGNGKDIASGTTDIDTEKKAGNEITKIMSVAPSADIIDLTKN